MTEEDVVNHPRHYTSHPSGVETIELTRHLDFCVGNAVKYLARHSLKGAPVQDVEKAIFYINKAMETAYERDLDRLPIMHGEFRVSLPKWYSEEENNHIKIAVASLCSYPYGTTVYPLKVALTAAEALLEEARNAE